MGNRNLVRHGHPPVSKSVPLPLKFRPYGVDIIIIIMFFT